MRWGIFSVVVFSASFCLGSVLGEEPDRALKQLGFIQSKSGNLDLGPPMTVEMGKKCVITAKTTAKKVTWRISSGVEVMEFDGGKSLAVWAPPGTYTFLGAIASGDEVVFDETQLTVTGNVPLPVEDRLLKAVKEEYEKDTSPSKAADKVKLLAVYISISERTKDFTTDHQLFSAISSMTRERIEERLKPIRVLFGIELEKILRVPQPTPQTLTATEKKDAEAMFKKFIKILEEVK